MRVALRTFCILGRAFLALGSAATFYAASGPAHAGEASCKPAFDAMLRAATRPTATGIPLPPRISGFDHQVPAALRQHPRYRILDLLGRGGRMTAAIAAIGQGAFATEAEPFRLDREDGDYSPVELAIRRALQEGRG